jgi:hypothetical protein
MGNWRWPWVLCALLFACPNDDAAGSHGSPCAAHAAWEKRCDAEQPYWGETECLENNWQYVRDQFLDAMNDCFETLACDASDDRCEEAGLKAIGITDEQDVADDAAFHACLDRTHACSVLDDYCVAVVAYTDEGREKLADCLDLDCSRLEACLRDPNR